MASSSGTGLLRTYLGTAPGVGKTYAMLAEGRQRAENGEYVVIGWVERHGRSETRAQRGDLELIPPRTVEYRGGTFRDLDVEAVLASGADLVLVDELAHLVPDTRRWRWEEVSDLLANGLDVLTTANIANLSSVRDYAAQITGVGAVEYVPDEFVRSGEIELVDLPAEALRQRIISGKVYSADLVGGALADYFRASNLEALSELGRAWVEGNAQAVGDDLLVRRGLVEPELRPVVVAGVSGSSEDEGVIRDACLIARQDDADLLVVHVNVLDGSSSRRQRQALERNRELASELGGSYIEVEGNAPAKVLADIARARGAARVVVASHPPRLGLLRRFSFGSQLRRLLPQVTVDEVQAAARV
jgi:two-component system, OmpR family, sensor histidine kinase KdpD